MSVINYAIACLPAEKAPIHQAFTAVKIIKDFGTHRERLKWTFAGTQREGQACTPLTLVLGARVFCVDNIFFAPGSTFDHQLRHFLKP